MNLSDATTDTLDLSLYLIEKRPKRFRMWHIYALHLGIIHTQIVTIDSKKTYNNFR